MSKAYDDAVVALREAQTAQQAKSPTAPMFRSNVNTEALYSAYLAGIPEDERPTYICTACRRNIKNYGNLVTIDDKGELHSVMFPNHEAGDNRFSRLFNHLGDLVARTSTGMVRGTTGLIALRKVTSGGHVGCTSSNGYEHVGVVSSPIYTSVNQGKVMTEINDEFSGFMRRYKERGYVNLTNIQLALDLSTRAGERLNLRKSHQGMLKNLQAILTHIASLTPPAANNVVRKAATGRGVFNIQGFVNSSVDTLLESLVSADGIEAAIREYNKITDGMHFQRPTVAPTQTAMERALEYFTEQGYMASMERRNASMDEIEHFLYFDNAKPETEQSSAAKVLESMMTKNKAVESEHPNFSHQTIQSITLLGFLKDVAPKAIRMAVAIGPRYMPIWYTTAVNPDAPAIYKWDKPEHRYPVAHFRFNEPIATSRLLGDNRYVWLNGLSITPDDIVDKALNVVLGTYELPEQYGTPPSAIFAECLNRDLYEHRSVVEAVMQKLKLQPIEGPVASCVGISEGVTVYVKTATDEKTYKIVQDEPTLRKLYEEGSFNLDYVFSRAVRGVAEETVDDDSADPTEGTQLDFAEIGRL